METSALSNRILFAESHTTLGQPESRRQPFRRCFRWHLQARCECRRLLPLFSSKNTSTSYSYGVNGARLKKTRSLTVPFGRPKNAPKRGAMPLLPRKLLLRPCVNSSQTKRRIQRPVVGSAPTDRNHLR